MPRAGEKDGREYNFTTQDVFLKLVDEGGFIEHARFGGNYYGTSVKAVRDVAERGRICVLDIEMEVCTSYQTDARPGFREMRTNVSFCLVQGVKQVQRTDLNARFLFLSPPSEEVLEQRLRGRGTDSEEDVKKRLEQAKKEIAFAKEAGEKIVVNDDLERAYQEVDEWVVDGGRYGAEGGKAS